MTIEESNAEEVQNSGELISAIREKTKRCYDLIELKRIAFNEIKLPKRKYMATKRCFYVRQITSQFSPTPIHKTESSSQWFRRKSAEMFGLNTSEHKIVVSSDRSKIAILRKTYRSLNEISILLANNSESVLKTFWSLKDAVIIGVTNDGKRLVFSHFSSKTMSKVKNDIKIDLIGVNFDVFDGFYLEESDSAIMICSSGLVSKCKVSKRQFETIMIMNDKNLNVVSSHLNVDYGLVWLDSVSQKNSHTFIAFDVDNLDVFTIIETDLFTIDRFIANPCDTESVIVVKTEPINGKLRKVIDILSDDFQEKRQSQPLEDVLDIHSLSLSADSEMSDSECLIVLITRNSFDIYIEYKYRNLWMKRKLLVSDCESCPLKTIKIIGVSTEDSIWKVTVLVVDNSTHTIQLDIGPGQH